MARLLHLFAAAGLVLLVAMAEATTKTIITTTNVEDNPTGRSRTEMTCTQQMEQMMLNHCMRYLETGSKSMGQRRMAEPTSAEKALTLCCMQLRIVDEMCRCDAMKMMMNQKQWPQQQMGQVMAMAENLPNKCKVKPEMCQMQAVWF